MMARVVVLLVLVLMACLLLVQDVEAMKKKHGKHGKAWANKKTMKRRVATIVHELQSNVTALWKEVKQLSQPVHVHLHGDGHVMDDDHRHHDHHEEHDHDHHDHHDHDHGDHDHKAKDKGHDHDKDHAHDKHHGHKHPHHPGSQHGDKMEMMMKKKMMIGGPNMMSGHGQMHGKHDDDDDKDMEGWKEKYMHQRHSGTHVHIHLHTGQEEEEEKEDSKHHHAHPPLPKEYRYARCDVSGNSAQPFKDRQNIKGTIFFRQLPNHPLEAKGRMQGFKITHEEKQQQRNHTHLRGLHGHEFGDMSKGCNSLGGHLNPYGASHGGPGGEHRHVGDFGNIEVKEDGTAVTSFNDTVASLFGFESMLGRSLVIHAGADDQGHGHDAGSKKTGNAGARIACCLIVATPEPSGVWPKN